MRTRVETGIAWDCPECLVWGECFTECCLPLLKTLQTLLGAKMNASVVSPQTHCSL